MFNLENRHPFLPIEDHAFFQIAFSNLSSLLLFILFYALFLLPIIPRLPTLQIILLTILILSALLLANLLYAYLFTDAFVFNVDEHYLFVKKGVVKTTITLMPYEKIQDVNVYQDFWSKLFGLWSVMVSTAASTGGSEIIFGLSKDNAEALQKSILSKVKEAKNVVE
ncbi:MAG: PH domain-containing protein [Candidatus Micrarchaeia archaeon]